MSTEKSRKSTSICTRINTISRQLTGMTFRRSARAGRLRGASKFAIQVKRRSSYEPVYSDFRSSDLSRAGTCKTTRCVRCEFGLEDGTGITHYAGLAWDEARRCERQDRERQGWQLLRGAWSSTQE